MLANPSPLAIRAVFADKTGRSQAFVFNLARGPFDEEIRYAEGRNGKPNPHHRRNPWHAHVEELDRDYTPSTKPCSPPIRHIVFRLISTARSEGRCSLVGLLCLHSPPQAGGQILNNPKNHDSPSRHISGSPGGSYTPQHRRKRQWRNPKTNMKGKRAFSRCRKNYVERRRGKRSKGLNGGS